MQLNDIIDLNLLDRFLTNLRSLFATKSEVAAKQDALIYNATSGTSGTAAVTSSPYCAAIWRVDLSDKVTELYSGLTILLKVPVAGNGSYGTLLRIDGTTAADDSSSNLYPVCANVNSMISTRYAVGCIIALTFDASQVGQTLYYKSSSSSTTAANGTGWTKPGCWKVSDYDTNTTTTYGTLDYYFRPYTGTRLTPYKIVALDKDNRVIPITTEQYCGTYSSSTSYVVDDIVVYDSVYYKCITAGKNKTPSTSTSYWQTYTMPAQFTPTATPFRPEKLRFYGSSTLLAAGAATGAQTLTEIGYNTSVCAYTFRATISSYRVIYLQGTYNRTTGLFTLDSGANYYKLVPCNTANITLSSYFTSGKYYILLGSTHSSNNYFQLFMVNTMYYFDGTNLVPYELKLIDDAAATAGDENVIETVKVNGTALTPDANKAVDITVPSVPTISTDISTDASSDVKTASPKAVKTFVEGKGYTNNTGTITSIKMNGSTVANSGEADLGTVITSHQNIKKLKTDNTSAQSTNSSEDIAGSGTINLHKVAKTGTYSDLIGTPTIPAAVTETTVSNWGFTKNTGTYSKPSGGIPLNDLESSVQTSLGKADTALQSFTEQDPVFGASAASGITSSDITSWNGKAEKVTEVNHGTSDTTFAITPNILHKWGTINSLTLSYGSSSGSDVKGYWFKFTAGSSFTALTLPTGVVWAVEPEIESGKTYEVLIIDGLATYTTEGADDVYATKSWANNRFQQTLVSGTNIKTINNTSLLGSGDININFDTALVASSGSTLTAAVDTIYTYSSAVSSLAVTLPAVTGNVAKALSIILTTSSSISLTFSSADSTTILYHDGYEIEASTMYEINALYVGTAWIIGASKITTS